MIHLTLQERKVILFLSFLFILGLGLSVLKKTTGCNFCLIDIYSHKTATEALDINLATRQELVALPDIGEKTADAIIAARVKQGGFKDMSELKNIKGITDVKLKRLEKYLFVR
jgi:competence ComEA-like helix-hairpin-helix protein